MTPRTWIKWSTKQLADLGMRLMRQGYNPASITNLRLAMPEFGARFDNFEQELETITAEMQANPEGYHHYGSLQDLIGELLCFTNLHRGRFLQAEAKIA